MESGEIEGRESRLHPLQGKETKNEFEKTLSSCQKLSDF